MFPDGADPDDESPGSEVPGELDADDGAFGTAVFVPPGPELLAIAGGVVMLPGVPPTIVAGAGGTTSFPAIAAPVPADVEVAGGLGMLLGIDPGAADAILDDGGGLVVDNAGEPDEVMLELEEATGVDAPGALIEVTSGGADSILLAFDFSAALPLSDGLGVFCASSSGVAVSLL